MPDFLNIDEYRNFFACSPNESQINPFGFHIHIEAILS